MADHLPNKVHQTRSYHHSSATSAPSASPTSNVVTMNSPTSSQGVVTHSSAGSVVHISTSPSSQRALSATAGTLVLTSQQSAAITQHLMMQQQQQQLQQQQQQQLQQQQQQQQQDQSQQQRIVYGTASSSAMPSSSSSSSYFASHQSSPHHQHHTHHDPNEIVDTMVTTSTDDDAPYDNRLLIDEEIMCDQVEQVIQVHGGREIDEDNLLLEDDGSSKPEFNTDRGTPVEHIHRYSIENPPAFVTQQVIQSTISHNYHQNISVENANHPAILQYRTHDYNDDGAADDSAVSAYANPVPMLSSSHTRIRTSSNSLGSMTTSTPVFGRLSYKDSVLYISDNSVEIGRNSTTSSVHFHVGKNSFVSRKHLQVLFDQGVGDFYLVCVSKNGVFVDDTFQRKTVQPMKLPRTCTFRFPSTVIRVVFENLCEMSVVDDDAKAIGSPPMLESIGDSSHNEHHVESMDTETEIPATVYVVDDPEELPPQQQQELQQYHEYQQEEHQEQHVLQAEQEEEQHSQPPHQFPESQQQQQQHPPPPPVHHHPNHQKMDDSNSAHVIYAPLKISIPLDSSGAAMATIEAARAAGIAKQKQRLLLLQQQHQQASEAAPAKSSSHKGVHLSIAASGSGLKIKSPFPSPTGTISAANSCPTSPRHTSFHDYSSYGHGSGRGGGGGGGSGGGGSRNGNSSTAAARSGGSASFQDDLFQVPAAASASGSGAAGISSSAATTSNNNEFEKPPYSYAQLIVQSISASTEKQLTLSGIYSFITKHYQYYRKESNKGWQNSIRHNLSLNRYFIKVARSQDEPGKGSFWRIDPTSESKLIDQSYKKRRQRGSQCLRTPYGMPRSAPVSPSHVSEYQNSADSSPLHDIVLQSAPGSPGRSSGGGADTDSEYLMLAPLSGSSSSYSSFGNFPSSGPVKRPAPPKAHQSSHRRDHFVDHLSSATTTPINVASSSAAASSSTSADPSPSTGYICVRNSSTSTTQPPPLVYEESRYVQIGMDHLYDVTGEDMEVANTTTVVTTSSDAHGHHHHQQSESCPSSPEPKRQRYHFDNAEGVLHMAATADPPTSAATSPEHLDQSADPTTSSGGAHVTADHDP